MRKKKLTWYEKITNALTEMETVDHEEDTNGYPTIHWLIAEHMLDGYEKYEMIKHIDDYVHHIKVNLYNALAMMTESGVKVFWALNGKTIRFITLNPQYKDAELVDLDRIVKNVEKIYSRAKLHIEFKHPNKLLDFQRKLITQ